MGKTRDLFKKIRDTKGTFHAKKGSIKDRNEVHSRGNQPWVFFARNDAKAETPVLWPPHAKG